MSSEPIKLHMLASIPITSSVEGPLRRHSHTYDLMRQCIHCGFCLPTCPTYAVLGVEMDSPRGRIYQMQAVADGKLDISNDFVEHMYCCVGCRACETACPSGVQFGKLIEAAREHIQLAADASTSQEIQTQQVAQWSLPHLVRRFFFNSMLPSRPVLTLVFGGLKVYQRSGLQKLARKTGLLTIMNILPTPFQGKLKVPDALMDSARGAIFPTLLSEVIPAIGQRKYKVGFISGCIMDQVFRDINEATIRVLAANGCEVITPPQQGCCGALHVHGGDAEQSRELARHNIAVFEPYDCDAIIINSAGCGSTLKEYDHLLRDDLIYADRARAFSTKVKDISEFLMSIDRDQTLGQIKRTVVYHDACHLLHGQKIKQQPRQLLQSIPGITLVDLKESDWCCGSAGIYNITNQKMAQELLERKMDHIAETGASMIATGNPGCMMQIAMGARQRGMQLEVVHPIQLLDEAYRTGKIYSVATDNAAGVKTKQNLLPLLLGIGAGIFAACLFLRRKRNSKETV